MPGIRQATVDDLDAIIRIWEQGIRASLGGPPPEGKDYRGYFAGRLANQTDLFHYEVVENTDGEVVAWQSLTPFRSNPAVAGVMAELSAYASPDHATARMTHAGLKSIFAHADRSALHYVVAFISADNEAALRLGLHFGMERMATLPRSPKAPDVPELAYLVYTCKPV